MNTPRDVNDSRREGRKLAQAFQQGAQLQARHTSITLQRGEICLGADGADLLQFLETDAQWMHKSGGYYGGGLLGLAALRGAQAIGNQARKARASRDAAGQWRVVDAGMCHVTSRRFALQGQGDWIDIWFSEIRVADCDGHAISFHLPGWAPTQLRIAFPDYWFVMFNKAAFDRVLWPPYPDDEPPPDSPPPVREILLPDDEPAASRHPKELGGGHPWDGPGR